MLCIYCQEREATTRDHVPPKGLFPSPKPNNLITVPCCDPCNAGFKNNDEYFLILSMEWSAGETMDGSQILAGRIRDMGRKDRRKLWKRVASRAEVVDVFTPSGLYAGRTMKIMPEKDRILAVVERTIRGLYYDQTGEVLPVTAVVKAGVYETYAKTYGTDPSTRKIIDGLKTLEPTIIGRDTFQFRYTLIPDKYCSLWYLEFYKRHGFVGSTADAEELKMYQAGQREV